MNNSNVKVEDKFLLDNVCPECQSSNIIFNSLQGESVCGNCGLVLRDHIIDSSTQGARSFSDDDDSDKNQNGTPITPLLPDISLLTVIDQRGNLSNQMKRIIKWDTRMSWSSRNLLIATTEIKRIGQNPDYSYHP